LILPSRRWLILPVFIAVLTLGCSGDDDDSTPTTEPSAEPSAVASATAAVATPVPTATPSATATPSPVVTIDPCTLRDSLEGQPLTPGPSFELNETDTWQLCIGGAAAGSSEKYLYMTDDGAANWTLLSMTTLGNPPPEAGVGELPNGNAAEAIFFIDEENGWLGLSSPGVNLYRSEDGGVFWAEAPVLEPGLPVTAIDFSDAQNGTLTTPDGDWVTVDGGATWAPSP
jgi:hypothetical protein